MPSPTNKASFDSAHDPRGDRGLRYLAAALAVIFLLLAGTSALGQEPGQQPDQEANQKPNQEATQETGQQPAQEPATPLAVELKAQLDALPDGPVTDGLRRHYAGNGWRAGWVRRDDVQDRPARDLLAVLESAAEQGLDPDDYGVAELRQRLRRPEGPDGRMSDADLAAVEIALSQAFLAYANDLLHGRLSPTEVDDSWHLEPRQRDLAQVLGRAFSEPGGPAGTARRLEPAEPRYRRLKEAYDEYRRLAADGGWPTVPEGDVVEAGEAMEPQRYRALVERLSTQGFLDRAAAEERLARLNTPEAPSGPIFDEELSAALKRFQVAHGLREDGILGPNSVAELNVSAADRARVIALNLERWRWLPESLGERYVEVNLPGFTLHAMRDGQAALEMPVVVGKQGWETPVLRESMEHVVVNPYWNIPQSILEADILPKLRQNPSYLRQQNMEAVDPGSGQVVPASASALAAGNLRLRQKPGPNNALGTIKFIFPNAYNVYLHDTPAEHAFERTDRSLSHGCVRVERPLDLADFVFEGHGEVDGAEVGRLISSREQRTLELAENLPVYFLYWTAFVSDDGQVQFRRDLYGYDEKHTEALEARGRAS